MKKFFVISILLLVSTIAFGQQSVGENIVINSTNPPIKQKMIDAYIRFTEWHFEISLTAEDRQKFENLLVQDLKNGNLTDEVRSGFQSMEKYRNELTWLQIAENHKQNVTEDETNRMIEGLRGNGEIVGDGLRSQTMREANKGSVSSKFLMSVLPGYEKPLIDTGSYQTNLERNYVDALYEFSTYKMEMVTGKKIGSNKKDRQQFEDRLIATWKDKDVDRTNLYFWTLGIKNDWLIWRVSDFNFYERMTPFQQKEQLAEWGQDLMRISPQVKPYLERRIKEYKDYVAKMPSAEIKAEVEAKRRRDQEFNFAIQKLKLEREINQASYKVMRQALLESHVTNMNIIENVGNTGYVWELKP